MSNPDQESQEQGFIAKLSNSELMGKLPPEVVQRLEDPNLNYLSLKAIARDFKGGELQGATRQDEVDLPSGMKLVFERDGYGNIDLAGRWPEGKSAREPLR